MKRARRCPAVCDSLTNCTSHFKTRSLETWAATLGQTSSLILTASVEDKLVGFVSSIVVADELQVENLSVSKERRGQGIGKELMTKLITMYSKLPTEDGGTKTCLLEVREGSPAVDFYLKLGFKQNGRRPRFYPDGCAAVLMTLCF